MTNVVGISEKIKMTTGRMTAGQWDFSMFVSLRDHQRNILYNFGMAAWLRPFLITFTAKFPQTFIYVRARHSIISITALTRHFNRKEVQYITH